MSYVGRGHVDRRGALGPPEPDILMVSGKLDRMVGGSSAPQGSGYRG